MHPMKAKKIERLICSGDVDAVKGACYFCGKEVNGGVYCFGCREFVCQDCIGEDPPMGKHDVSEHKS